MHHMKKQKAFTLVELIVVITILAILWTIAFISLQWYSLQARDSTRISDLSSIKTSLELFHLEAGKYPQPTDWVNITYSWAIVWNQWTFWDSVYNNVGKLDKIPKDLATDKLYTYSVTATKNQYQLWWMIEGDLLSFNPSQPSLKLGKEQLQVNAWDTSATAYTTWNYNGQIVKSLTWTTCNILAIPTIITNDILVTDLQQIVNSWSLVYNWYKNLPSSFKTSKFKYNWWFNFIPNNLVAYTDVSSCTILTSIDTYTGRVNLLKWIQDAYSWTLVKNDWEIKNILALNINTISPSNEVISYAGNYVNNVLGGNIIVDNNSWTGNSWWWIVTYTVSWSFGVNANWATVNVCWINVTADSSWNFTASSNSWITCNNITATRTGYDCITTTNWPASLTSNVTNISWICSASWRVVDTNCDVPNTMIGSQVWAWCNSTLWTWVEWWKKDNGTNWTVWTCYDYNFNNTWTCTIWISAMASSTKANTWYTWTNNNWSTEFPNIWWKLYIWANSPSACPAWWHVPSDSDFEILETTLNWSNCRNSTDGFLCDSLWWKLHNTYADTNNMANAFKIPLSGNRNPDGITFSDRGSSTNLWSSDAFNATYAYGRGLHATVYPWIYRAYWDKSYSFSVRCIKN